VACLVEVNLSRVCFEVSGVRSSWIEDTSLCLRNLHRAENLNTFVSCAFPCSIMPGLRQYYESTRPK
jgi:hypothetical protein